MNLSPTELPTAGNGKAMPVRNVKKHYWEKLHLVFSVSETNFTVNSLLHHNTHAFIMDDLHFHQIKSVQSGKATG